MKKPKKPVFRREDTVPHVQKNTPIVTVQAQESFPALILSEQPAGFWTHWSGRATRPCLEKAAECPGCQRGQPLRWKGFIHVISHRTPKSFFIELTPLSVQNLLASLEGKPMRGAHVQVQRERKNNIRSPLVLTVIGHHEAPDKLKTADDPTPTLLAIWGYVEGE